MPKALWKALATLRFVLSRALFSLSFNFLFLFLTHSLHVCVYICVLVGAYYWDTWEEFVARESLTLHTHTLTHTHTVLARYFVSLFLFLSRS